MTDIKELTIQGSVVTPSSPAYEKAISRMSATSVLHPAYVTYPASPSDVPVIIRFGLSQKPPLEISVKGGGCNTSTASSSEGGIVIDLSRLNLVKVADDKQSVSVQGGALWGDVYSEVERHDLLVVGGNVWSVGVGGFLTGGGYSNLSGQYGLAVDNMLSATVVLADGRIVKSSKDEEADLFWAIRGIQPLQFSTFHCSIHMQAGGTNLESSQSSYLKHILPMVQRLLEHLVIQVQSSPKC